MEILQVTATETKCTEGKQVETEEFILLNDIKKLIKLTN